MQAKRITGTPNQILAKLEQVLKPHPSQTYTVTIWKRDGSGGHAVTPYEVVNKGGGMFQVLIYDNNWPDQTRAISFDTKADTWTYDAASNPDQPDSVYEGDASTKTISLSPTSPGLGTQPCPFCAKEPTKGTAKAGDNTEEITLPGSSTEHATLIVTDDAGRQLGYINGNLVNQIPGARVDQVISSGDWTDNIAPDFFLPADVKYTITLDGTSLSAPDNETLAITGPSYDLSVGPIPMRPGDKDTLVIEPDATQLSYTSSRKESPTLTLGVSDNRADYSFQIAGVSDQPGSTLNLGLPPEGGNLNLQYVGAAAHVEREPQDDPVQRARRPGLRPQRHPPGRRQTSPSSSSATGPTPARASPWSSPTTANKSTQTLADQQPRQLGRTSPPATPLCDDSTGPGSLNPGAERGRAPSPVTGRAHRGLAHNVLPHRPNIPEAPCHQTPGRGGARGPRTRRPLRTFSSALECPVRRGLEVVGQSVSPRPGRPTGRGCVSRQWPLSVIVTRLPRAPFTCPRPDPARRRSHLPPSAAAGSAGRRAALAERLRSR